MVDYRSRRGVLTLAVGTGLTLAGCLESNGNGSGNGNGNRNDGDGGTDDGGGDTDDEGSAAWRTEPLEDVTTGETFSIGEFEQPVLLHTFAIWCSTCQRQHEEFATLEEGAGGEFVAIELNVDPNEDHDAVRAHAEDHGFDWPFAVAPSSVTGALVDEFGSVMTSPPQSPVVLVCPGGDTHVLDDDTVVAASDLGRALEDRW
ncbi:TlpA family protein disulfide reductase [Natrialbaceae archaeon A-gly3]